MGGVLASSFTEISKSDYSLSMRTLFIIPLVLLSLVSFPSWGLSMDDLVYREGLYYKKFSDIPFTGEIDGQSTGSIQSGSQEGDWIYFHENGQLFTKGNYQNGKRNGDWVYFHENGKVSSQRTYKNDKLEGSWRSYRSNGRLWEKGTFTNDGKEGSWIRYYENGRVWEESTYSAGIKELSLIHI